MQGLSRDAVEKAVADLLSKDTQIGHATLIGIERGARMPSYDIIAGMLKYLDGDWDGLFDCCVLPMIPFSAASYCR
jgi:transcriptional regulator with XRE-family HTH domain